MERKTRLYLVRHCQSTGNLQNIFQGQTDADVSAMGEKQLALLGLRFRDVPVDAVYSSPLRRALKTAEAVNAYHNLPITQLNDLMEIDVGELEGRKLDSVFDGHPALAARWNEAPQDCAFPGGESVAQVYGRAKSALSRILRENAAGVRVIKALASQRREQDRFEQANRRDRAAEERAGRVMALTNPITDLLLNLGLTLVVLVGAVQVNAGAMPAGQIVAFLTYFALIQSATLGIAKVFVRISKGVASARRIRQVLEEPPTQSLSGADARRPELLGMEGATFSYRGVEPDLADVSFTLQKGQTLGILGPTGNGKTTLVSLLLRLYDADSGVVWVGGQDVRCQTPRAVQDRFGVAFQSQSLIAGTIYENIAFLRDLPRQDVEAAVDTAQAREFVSRLPQGLDTPLELRGANLSGGQRQRLLIARALAGRPEILVLDNADSALDYQTAARLWAALRRDFPRTTLVIISERVASVRDADCILVLEHGRIMASGRHQDLLVSAPRYRKMAELQMGGETV